MLADLEDARVRLDVAQKDIRTLAKTTIESIVKELFVKHSDLETISWAQKSSEYNDEGMSTGIVGPVSNVEDDGNNYPEWVYAYNSTVESRLSTLSKALELIGVDILADIYGDEYIVNATAVITTNFGIRNVSRVNFKTEYAGY